MFAGASPCFVASPLRAYISPAYPTGSSSAIPVGMTLVRPGAMTTGMSRQAYRSAPAAYSLPYAGSFAFLLSFLIATFILLSALSFDIYGILPRLYSPITDSSQGTTSSFSSD